MAAIKDTADVLQTVATGSTDATSVILALIFIVSCLGVHQLYKFLTMFHNFEKRFIASQTEVTEKLKNNDVRILRAEETMIAHERRLDSHDLKIQHNEDAINFYQKLDKDS